MYNACPSLELKMFGRYIFADCYPEPIRRPQKPAPKPRGGRHNPDSVKKALVNGISADQVGLFD